MHWSVSKSCEYCSADSTVEPFACGAVRSCPGSGGFADVSGTSFAAVSVPPGIPDASCEGEGSPRVSFDEHRRRPTSAERHGVVNMLPAVFGDDGCGTTSAPAVGESPKGRTRRRKWLGHWLRAGLRSDESLFFRLKSGIVAFFPCLRASEFDLPLMKNRTQGFKADRRNNLFLQKICSQFVQRPSFKRTAQEIRWTLRRLGNKGFVIFGKFSGSTGATSGLQRFKADPIELFDNSANVMFRVMNQLCNSRHLKSLIRRQHHLGTPHLNAAGAASKNSLNLLTFANTEIPGIQTHKKSFSIHSDTESFLRVCLYNTRSRMAQVLNTKEVNII